MSTPARADAASSTTGPGPTSITPASFPRLDKYELVEEIGHGGMATVYRARDPRLGRDVAVKVIHKHLRENAEVARRFLAEARAAAKLRHPGIVEVYDVSSDEDSERYLVVELLRGTTLRKVLQLHREMPAEVGAAIVLELCEALEHAHESGIIHRDVKPENVLVELPADRALPSGRTAGDGAASGPKPQPAGAGSSHDGAASGPKPQPAGAGSSAPDEGKDEAKPDEGEPRTRESDPRPSDRTSERRKTSRLSDPGVVIKLTDFGIAKVLDAQGVTSTGQVLGSPAHMAPEQIEGGEVDSRTDVFALGVLMYECLVGHLPFEGKNPAQVLRRVLDGSFSPADRERPTVGGRWAKILAGALGHHAADRTASPGVLADQIRAELEAVGITGARGEVTAFFADPEAYSAELAGRLVPRLLARGESARKEGDVEGAAADFNRALALAPTDLSILKRVTALTSNASRKQLVKRAAKIVAGSIALGFVAFGVARFIKARPVDPQPEGTERPTAANMAPVPSFAATVGPEASANAHPAASVAERTKHTAASVVGTALANPTTASAPGSSVRKVRFQIVPRGATLKLDGQTRSWLETFELPVGSHAVEVEPPNGSGCCKKLTSSVTISAPPADKPDKEQVVPLSLELNPAQVRLVGAPAGGECSCVALNRIFRGGLQEVMLPRAEWSGNCTFSVPASPETRPRNAGVTLRAGEKNDIAWPGD